MSKETVAPIIQPVSDFCVISRPLTFAKKPESATEDQRNRFDTPETVQQIVDYMLRRNAVCG